MRIHWLEEIAETQGVPGVMAELMSNRHAYWEGRFDIGEAISRLSEGPVKDTLKYAFHEANWYYIG